MANRQFRDLKTLGAGRYVVAFQIIPNGGGAPSVAEDGDDAVASVSRTGAGVFQVTLKDTYLAVVSVNVQPQLNAAAATIAVVTGATAVATTKTFSITTMTESAGSFAAADIAANANNKLLVTLVLRDSGLG